MGSSEIGTLRELSIWVNDLTVVGLASPKGKRCWSSWLAPVATVRGDGDESGLGVASFGKFGLTTSPTFSYRLAQVEAGVGVYGRACVNINPDYGSYYRVGVLLTEARLAPTNGTHLDGFNPCEGCEECGKVCPIKAIDVTKEPGTGYDRERCMRFIMGMSERSGTQAKICCQCFSVCPWSMGRKGGTA